MEAFGWIVGSFLGVIVCLAIVIGIVLMFSSGVAKLATRNIVKIVRAIKQKVNEGGDEK